MAYRGLYGDAWGLGCGVCCLGFRVKGGFADFRPAKS